MFALLSLSASIFEGQSGKLAANLSVPDLCWMQTPKVSRATSDEMSGSEDSEELHGTRLCLGREEQGSSGGILLNPWDSAARRPCGSPSAAPLRVLLQTGLPTFYSWLVNSPRKKKSKPLFWSESTLAERLHFLLFVCVAVHK